MLQNIIANNMLLILQKIKFVFFLLEIKKLKKMKLLYQQ
ncbi:hypothetical protein BMW23_0075 [Bodo saltans virus]|uniref:Uncharacterized protein n=1 Tax=Bodo saltans virus TaxID=2024608 RepID=A0A2H4UTG5_9VIRU|nr:hypothetical protein QJ851_gp0074 [Bodo saltans virus]ATZ80137.1 hypothetical protein BMW23_0075 [Bodo saltans virus]